VKAVIVIGDDANLSDADVAAFLRAAKLASRTKRDAEIVGMLDKSISLLNATVKDEHLAAGWRRTAVGEKSLAAQFAFDAKNSTDAKFDREMAQSEENEAKKDGEKAKAYGEASERELDEAEKLLKKLKSMPELKKATEQK
jgi:hypothetical protein